MASEYLQDLAFRQLSHAIMATANSVSGPNSPGNPVAAPAQESSIFDVVRRKLGRVQDVIQGIAAPLKRRSMYDELPEHVWPPRAEHIELSHMVQRGFGHAFEPCQLSNPTWCDFCGDFIWGLYKQCLRCQTCQYTCHQHCIPQVSLNCTSVSEDGTDLNRPSHGSTLPSHSPTDPRRGALETSLSLDSGYVGTGVARSLNSSPDLVAARSARQPNVSPSHRESSGDRQKGRVTRSASEGQVVVPHPQRSSPVFPGRAVQEVKRSPLAGQLSQQHHPAGRESSSPHTVSPAHHPVDPTVGESRGTASQPPQGSVIVEEGEAGSVVEETVTSQAGTDVAVHQDVKAGEGEQHTDLATEKDETDSGYRSGTIPDDKLPKVPSQATLDRQELKRKVAKFNHFVPAASLEVTGKESFQGFLKVTMNLIRPITMELGARPPSIYELLTREHIVEENTQQVAFYMPRDTHKSLHIDSETTTKEVVSSLLKKFHILDHPRKFAMYAQEFNDKNKLVRLRRLTDKDYPLLTMITWDPERIRNYRMVLQENETGEIVWDAFSLPELNNFLKVLDREEKETILELRHKYVYMRQVMEKRLMELRNQRRLSSKSKA